MGEVVTYIVKGHACNALPFLMSALLLRLHPEMLNPTLGEMIWSSLLPQPGSSLTREDVETFFIPLFVLRTRREKILRECPTSQIMEIQRPGLASFGVEQGNASGPLIDLTLIQTQGGNFADAQSCPVAKPRRWPRNGEWRVVRRVA